MKLAYVVQFISIIIIGILLADVNVFATQHWQFWAILVCVLAYGIANFEIGRKW